MKNDRENVVADKDEALLTEEPISDESTADDGKTEYVEFVGSDPAHGTEFYGAKGTHSIDRKHMKDYHDVDLGTKEVVWSRGKNGRFLVPTSELTPEVVAVLEKDPMFKVVSI